jgi:hypothetical protein
MLNEKTEWDDDSKKVITLETSCVGAPQPEVESTSGAVW